MRTGNGLFPSPALTRPTSVTRSWIHAANRLATGRGRTAGAVAGELARHQVLSFPARGWPHHSPGLDIRRLCGAPTTGVRAHPCVTAQSLNPVRRSPTSRAAGRLLAGRPIGPAGELAHAVSRLCAVRRGRLARHGAATQVWMPFVIARVVLSISGGSMDCCSLPSATTSAGSTAPRGDWVVFAVRRPFTAGWIIGPVLGNWFGAVYGLRPLLFANRRADRGQILPAGLAAGAALSVREPTRGGHRQRGSASRAAASRPHVQGAAVRVRRRLRADDERRHHQVRVPAALHGQPARHLSGPRAPVCPWREKSGLGCGTLSQMGGSPPQTTSSFRSSRIGHRRCGAPDS
jgi:hypothetical protein